MASKISFNTGKISRLNTFIPQAVIAGGLIYVSGMAGLNPETGKLIDDTFEGQARQAFTNIQTILQEAGSHMDNIVKTTIWMVSGQDPTFAAINKIYAGFFPKNPPARSAPQVMPFPGGILVSVECVALV
ncbi:RidA family protein [Mucilaginibacter sp. AW1-7]|uniref:RidA family protein n=1 Tax=Mucilaginibacter sp. AW1-7 TaxID=3349874 RepID=UPI003F73F086